ncbi:MAG: glycosyltransferase family 2 protein [Microcoleus sp.]
MFTENSKPVQNHQKYQYVFTVFTPTYNRRHTLHRVYDSLKAQTYRDFEWLIVDDGSTDNTRELVEQWQQENLVPIRYIYQENGHLHIAYNRGVREAQGELFLKLDSDDSCEPQALERFKYHWDAIPPDQKEKFSAVTCLCKDPDGKILGNLFPFNPTDSDSLEIRYRFNVTGEKWGFHRTDVLLQFLIHEKKIGFYIPEGVRWAKIAKKYKTRYVNEALRTYWADQSSIIRNSEHPQKYAIGKQIYSSNVLNEQTEWFRFAPLIFLRSGVQYSRFSFHLGTKISQQIANIKTPIGKILWLIALPLGYLVYLKDNYANKNV